MKIGAQLYSVRDMCGTRETNFKTFEEMKRIGYTTVQVSGIAYEAEHLRDICQELGLTIGLTHSDIKEIINDTDEIIRRHKIMGADMVGIGGGHQYRPSPSEPVDVDYMIKDLSEAVKKINDAGLLFGYHNHAFEFYGEVGSRTMDLIYEKTDWMFILDTGWVDAAGCNVPEEIERFKDRLKYVHLKDFIDRKEICPLYSGNTPIDDIMTTLLKTNTVAAYVEQDNAPNTGNSWGEMKKSIDGLKAKGWVK